MTTEPKPKVEPKKQDDDMTAPLGSGTEASINEPPGSTIGDLVPKDPKDKVEAPGLRPKPEPVAEDDDDDEPPSKPTGRRR